MFQVGQMVVSNTDWFDERGARILKKGEVYRVSHSTHDNLVGVEFKTGFVYMFEEKRFEEVEKVGCDKMKYDHVSVGQFVIGSLHHENGWSMRPEPKTHQTEKQAKKECERLAKLEPTKKFVYLEIKGACQVSGVTWE